VLDRMISLCNLTVYHETQIGHALLNLT